MTKDKIILKEENDALQISITMSSIMPCIKAIKQYKPQFKPQDIANGKYFKSNLLETIAEYFNDYLFQAIDDNTNQRTKETRSQYNG